MTDDKEDDRTQRAEEGRAAFGVMMRGFREVSVLNQQLVGVTAALAGKLDAIMQQLAMASEQQVELARQNAELVSAHRTTCEHMAALQQQIGVLVQVVARQNGVQAVGMIPRPQQPPPQQFPPHLQPQPDPFGVFGGAVVNGVLGHLRRGGGSRGAPPGY